MQILSVNTGPVRELLMDGKAVATAIDKTPIGEPVTIHALGLEGDEIGNTKHHGGPDQAVFAYAADYYENWRSELGKVDLPFGIMGENLTVQGWVDEDICIGDTYRVGGTTLQVTGPRIPCSKLERRVGVRGFAKLYAEKKRFGPYLRVIEPGEVKAGDGVTLIEKDPAGFGLIELAVLFLFRPKDVDAMKRALNVQGLGRRAREAFEQRIANEV